MRMTFEPISLQALLENLKNPIQTLVKMPLTHPAISERYLSPSNDTANDRNSNTFSRNRRKPFEGTANATQTLLNLMPSFIFDIFRIAWND
jgi:hypothetical protein